MKHYICTGGCEGVSEAPGVCTTPDCPGRQEPLEECNCEDGKHFGAFETEEEDIDGDDAAPTA